MSVPAPMKVTGLTVKNTLSANSAWLNELHVKDKKTKKHIEVMQYIDKKLESINLMEQNMKNTILEINKAVKEINNLKDNLNTTTPESVVGAKGDKGDPGVGVPGAPGKVGPRGLRGPKGDGVTKLAQLNDVDTTNLTDGCVPVWVASKKKFIMQDIFAE